jgi:tellurite resistance protein TerC
VIEKSLSVDNLFVFLLIFSYFKVPAESQRVVLLWGIIGAQLMRAIFILLGVALLSKYHWVIYIFGLILVYSGIKLFMEKDKEVHPDDNPVLKFFKKFFKVTNIYHGKKFWVKESGQWVATPLMVVLIVIETTDLIFAVDSIPAILAITKDPFIAYTSNIFAILGLRALYFSLHHLMGRFHLLHYGLGIILVFVGLKMLLESVIHVPIVVSLGIISLILTVSIIASWYIPEKKH